MPPETQKRITGLTGTVKAKVGLMSAAVIMAAGLLTGCAAAAPQPGAAERSPGVVCETSACPASAREVKEPADVIEAIDPTRDAILAETRVELTDYYVDHVALLAIGDMAADSPDEWPHRIADRDVFEQCLAESWSEMYERTAPGAPPVEPEEARRNDADELIACVETGWANWDEQPRTRRSRWIKPLLDTGWRLTAPAETARPYIKDEETDAGWSRLNAEYQGCAETAGPAADEAAGAGADRAAARFLEELARLMNCNQQLTIASLEPEPE